jgi:hypothetical protein
MRDHGIENLKFRRRQRVHEAVDGILVALDRRVVWSAPRPPWYPPERPNDWRREEVARDLYNAIKDMCAALGVTTE